MTILIGVGAQKSGTTWIADYLGRHPEFTISPSKELHYFDSYYSDQNRHAIRLAYWIKKTVGAHFPLLQHYALRAPGLITAYLGMLAGRDASYAAYMRRIAAITGNGGEITPAYSILDQAGFAAIRAAVPEARIVYIMRNPPDRLWSQMRFTHSVSEQGQVDQVLAALASDDHFRRRSQYGRTLRTLQEVFASDQLLVLFYENLFSPDTGTDTVRRLCDFLGIGFIEPQLDRQVHVSKSVALDPTERFRLVKALADEYAAVQELLGTALPANWLADIRSLEQTN